MKALFENLESGATVDQLLAYVTWLDTKTAILLFNKNKDLSQVLEQIEPALRAHSRFVRFEGKKNETEVPVCNQSSERCCATYHANRAGIRYSSRHLN